MSQAQVLLAYVEAHFQREEKRLRSKGHAGVLRDAPSDLDVQATFWNFSIEVATWMMTHGVAAVEEAAVAYEGGWQKRGRGLWKTSPTYRNWSSNKRLTFFPVRKRGMRIKRQRRKVS